MNGRFAIVCALTTGCLAAPPSGTGVGPDGDGTPRCGTLRALADDFEDGLSDWRWSPQGAWSVGAGAIELAPVPDTVAAIHSNQAWWVDGGELAIEIDASERAADSVVAVWLSGEEGNVGLVLEADLLSAAVAEPGFDGTRASVPFDPATRWWRIGRAGGQMRWATSADGEDWTEHEPFDAALAGPAELSIEHGADSVTSRVQIAAVGLADPPEPNCPLASLEDDFSRPTPRWRVIGQERCVVEAGGRLDLALTGPDACGLASRERFSLEESEVAVAAVDAGGCALNPGLEVQVAAGSFTLRCVGQEVPSPIVQARFDSDASGDQLGTADWDQDQHRFWRIRHAASQGGVVFETSPDGAGWNQLAVAEVPAGADLTEAEVALVVYSDDDAPVGGAAFDHFNILPQDE